jgi:hypothetical protein
VGCSGAPFEWPASGAGTLLLEVALVANATFTDSESRRVNALAWRWFGAQHALLGPAFLFLTIAKLFVLKRLVDFFLPKLAAQSQRRVAVCERVTLAAVAAAAVLIACCSFACCRASARSSFSTLPLLAYFWYLAFFALHV